jgi:EmrB/QacA subfamily drug resistance transporter
MVIVDGFVVNLALPKIGSDLHANFADLQWIVDGFLLSLSSLILIGGSLGDIFGRKRIYLLGLGGFTAASLICAAAPNTQLLIAARVLQGIFGALLVPGGLAIINTNFPKAERGRAIGRWSAWLAIMVPIGPLLGGYILKIASWRWIFLINLPLGLICGWLAVHNFKESPPEPGRRVDFIGALLAAGFLAGITYGLIEGPVNHWGAQALVPLFGGLIALAAFLVYESRHPDPMVRLSLFKSPNFLGSNLMTFLMYGALGGFTFILPIYCRAEFAAGIHTITGSIQPYGGAERQIRAAFFPDRRTVDIGPGDMVA